MCKIWEEVRDEGMKEGRKEGMKEGIKEGAKRSLLANIRTLMETMNLTAEQAMDALRVPAEERASVKSNLAAP